MVRLLAVALGFAWLVGCEQPTGIVVVVRGAQSASDLRLTVGEHVENSTYEVARETTTLKESGPYQDGFEIHLPRAALAAQAQIALVLDGAVHGDNGKVDIRRVTYAFSPSAGALLDVEMRLPAEPLAPGRWVCPSGAGEGGFVVSDSDDCDRDGWVSAFDLDDSNPLRVMAPGRLVLSADARFCGIALGPSIFDGLVIRGDCGVCDSGFGLPDSCLRSRGAAECTVYGSSATLPLSTLVDLPESADVTLATLTPMRAGAYFVPTKSSLRKYPDARAGEWAVAFERRLPSIDASWFVISNRATSPPSHVLVQVKFETGDGTSECKPKGR